MRTLFLTIAVAIAATACHSPTTSGDATAASVQEPATEANSCTDRELTDRLGRLHSLALATDEVPRHRLDELRSILAGLDPAGSREFEDGYPGAARFASARVGAEPTRAIYHDPRFEGEERPHILHWRSEALGRSDDWSDSIRRLHPDDGVYLALWRETTDEEVETLLVALKQAGVEEVSAVGQQDLPTLAELDAPPEARTLFAKMHGADGQRVTARTMATFELERLVFGAHGHEPDIDPRMLEPTMDLAQRSEAYIDFLQREYHRAGCDIDADHLAWMYRVRFLPDPPLAMRSIRLESNPERAGSTWQEILEAPN